MLFHFVYEGPQLGGEGAEPAVQVDEEVLLTHLPVRSGGGGGCEVVITLCSFN